MIKHFTLILLIFLMISCDNTKNEILEKKISELEKINKKMSAELKQIEFERLKNLQLNLYPNTSKFKVGKNNVVNGIFFEISKLHKYDVYQTDSLNTKESRKLLLKNVEKPTFEVNFKPKTRNDNKLYLLAVFKLDSLRLEFPGVNEFSVE